MAEIPDDVVVTQEDDQRFIELVRSYPSLGEFEYILKRTFAAHRIEAGLVVVPREPTEAMLDPLILRGKVWVKKVYVADMRAIYTAMIEAAEAGK